MIFEINFGQIPEAYLETSQASLIELFAKIVNN